MTLGRSTRAAALLATAALALAGCGGGGDEERTETEPPRVETAHKLPKLKRGWDPHLNRRTGIAIGEPPGWTARDRGTTTILRSPDKLIAITVTPDRTDEALGIPLAQFAARTFAALPGFEGELRPSEPRPFAARYPAVQVVGRGTAADTGVRQRLRVVVMRRDELVTVVAVIAENARRADKVFSRNAIDAVRTIRTRPVGSVPPG
ncbi:MAG TPA: hypothetical protein VIL04_09335 [Solirubrobacterales bacterium]